MARAIRSDATDATTDPLAIASLDTFTSDPDSIHSPPGADLRSAPGAVPGIAGPLGTCRAGYSTYGRSPQLMSAPVARAPARDRHLAEHGLALRERLASSCRPVAGPDPLAAARPRPWPSGSASASGGPIAAMTYASYSPSRRVSACG